MKNTIKYTKKYMAVGTFMVALSACASTPKETIAETMPVQEQVPAPVLAKPMPVEPVEEKMVAELPQAIPMGPTAGSVDHFKYVSGEDRIYFGYNQYDLTPSSRDILRRQAMWLNEYSNAILVVGGNADERGTREYNLALGARRADAVKAFLVSQGVSPSRITTVSYGKERPIDGDSNEAAWALNRNAHSAVLTGGNS